MNMSVMSSLHVHKCPCPASTQVPRHDSCFSPHHLQVSHRRKARVRCKLMVGLCDGRKWLQAVIRRGIRSGLCEQHHKTVEELVEEADDKLFTNVMYNKQHVPHSTLPGTMDTKYHLMPRPHNFKLTAKNSSITKCDFFTRMLFKDVY